MEWIWPLVIWSGIICSGVALLFFANSKKSSTRLPPGPPGWPVIGNIFDLDAAGHRTLAALSQKYGQVMWLRLGAVNTMVVSSAEAAMVMFKNHDAAFSGRTTNEAMRANSYHEGSMALADYGPYWRMLRRVCTTELFTNSRINGTEDLRTKCVDNMIRWMRDEAREKGTVEVARFVSLMNFNVTSNVLFSKDIVNPQSEEGAEFFSSLSKYIEVAGRPNIADFFPFLRRLDPQGIRKEAGRRVGITHKFVNIFLKERISERQRGLINTKKDFLDVMLDFRGNQKDGEPAKISEKNIGTMLLELFQASTDTAPSTIEWAMTELLCNPRAMKKVQGELDEVVGLKRKVEEGDIANLGYLQAVVKETLRLHPAVPLLIPRKAMEDTEFMGYSIPKGTQILVNVWAIGRDPVSWKDPLSFEPERFLSSNTDYKGCHFQYIPFGAGRRMCVGMSLAHRTLHLALASMIQSFEWALEDGVTPENMDMSVRLGVSLRKAIPLKVVLKNRAVQNIGNPNAKNLTLQNTI